MWMWCMNRDSLYDKPVTEVWLRDTYQVVMSADVRHIVQVEWRGRNQQVTAPLRHELTKRHHPECNTAYYCEQRPVILKTVAQAGPLVVHTDIHTLTYIHSQRQTHTETSLLLLLPQNLELQTDDSFMVNAYADVSRGGRKYSTTSPENPFILGKRSRTWATKQQCWRGICTLVIAGFFLLHMLTCVYGQEQEAFDATKLYCPHVLAVGNQQISDMKKIQELSSTAVLTQSAYHKQLD